MFALQQQPEPQLPQLSKDFIFSRRKANITGGKIQVGKKRRSTKAVYSGNAVRCSVSWWEDREWQTGTGEERVIKRTQQVKRRAEICCIAGAWSNPTWKVQSLFHLSWILDFYYVCWQPACKLQKFIPSTAFDGGLHWSDENRHSKTLTGYSSASRKTQHRYWLNSNSYSQASCESSHMDKYLETEGSSSAHCKWYTHAL